MKRSPRRILDYGVVVLSWDEVRRGRPTSDGQNLVLHEFAHQLDQEDGAGDGARPRTPQPVCRLGPGLEHRVRAARQHSRSGRTTVLDDYGATNPAEFFAVATECFFEKPVQMKKKHPQLYAAGVAAKLYTASTAFKVACPNYGLGMIKGCPRFHRLITRRIVRP